MEWYKPNKLQLSSVYGVFRSARGSGRIRHMMERYGYECLLGQLIRLKVNNPLWGGADLLIDKLQRIHCRELFPVYYDPVDQV